MLDEPSPIGRPTDYTPDLAAKICAQLAMGKSVRTVCKADDMPSATTVFNWLGSRPEFVEQYTRAKEESADAHSEDMIDISDDGTNDYMEALGDEGGIAYRLNGENIQRSRLRVETRKWLAAKLKPKKYGEKITQEHTGKDGKDLFTEPTEVIEARVRAFLAANPQLTKGIPNE